MKSGAGAAWLVAAAAWAVILVFAASGAIAPIPALCTIGATAAAALAAALWSGPSASEGETFVNPTMMPDTDLLDAVIAAIADPVVVLGRDERVIAFNAQASDIAPGLRRGEPALLALRVPELVEAIRRVAAGGDMERVEFSERVQADRHFETYVIPVSAAADGRKFSLILTFHDLTPIRRVEEMRADFVANASHELRTPLATLSGFIETLRGAAKEDPAARERFLGIMEQQAWRMARLIDDLLSLSRIELNAHLRPDKPVDLVPILKQVVDALQMLAQEREVEVVMTAPPQPLVVLGDRDELIRVFENLVENALKYGGSGKRVEVTLSRVGTEASVAVRDYGPGIAAEHLPRLTERFYRVDVAGSRAQGGTGLGLALVKHILNRHRGRLAIDSRLGEGATFTVRLPLRDPRAA
ncbi:MAG TPA: ATP-binding protein [Pseudorhodoplanes sp.]|nr:ATP-binding protein [Pseudorhodoplanes sp.]